MKHAYLILAHNEFGLLQTLVDCLDDARNDIFVHIDKKVQALPVLHAEKSRIILLEDRIAVYWGDFSIVEAELALFRAARKEGPYAYYHLLSGVDLPLKSQDTVHRFFDAHQGKEFIGYTQTQMTPELVRKVQRWHLFPEDFKNRSWVKRVVRSVWIRVQELVGWKRNATIEFKKGSEWVSVTDAMAACFLEQEDWIRKVFRKTFCADEIVFQTLCWQSPLRSALYNTTDDGMGCMRLIGWRGSELVDWSAADYDRLAASPALFARKFNSRDPQFIERVAALSKPENES